MNYTRLSLLCCGMILSNAQALEFFAPTNYTFKLGITPNISIFTANNISLSRLDKVKKSFFTNLQLAFEADYGLWGYDPLFIGASVSWPGSLKIPANEISEQATLRTRSIALYSGLRLLLNPEFGGSLYANFAVGVQSLNYTYGNKVKVNGIMPYLLAGIGFSTNRISYEFNVTPMLFPTRKIDDVTYKLRVAPIWLNIGYSF